MSTHRNDDQPKRKRKVGAYVKFGLAGVALLGIGAAATSAAWTNDAWFSASATTPTIQLQGGNGAAPTIWNDADTTGTAVVIPSTAFANLAPGVAATAQIGLKNTSTVPLTVAVPTATWDTGFISTGSCSLAAVTTVTINGGATAVTLAPGAATTNVTVTVTPPSSWNGATTCQGKTGAMTLTFTGQTS